MSVRPVLGVLFAAAAVLVAGCLNLPTGGQELTEEEAGDQAETAMKSFAAAMGTREGGEIKRLHGTMNGDDASDEMGMGAMDLEMEFLWGANDVIKATVQMASGGFTFELIAWCTPSGTFVEWGDVVYTSRPVDVEDSEALCPGLEDTQAMQGQGLDFFESDEFDGLVREDVTINDDGSITATFTIPEENSLLTVNLDTKGRLSSFTMEDDEMSGEFNVEYGQRETLDAPEADARIPATIHASTAYDDEGETGTITESPETPVLSQIEARVVQSDWETGEEVELAAFALDGDEHTGAGYTFRYHDEDGDGRVSENDTYTFSRPADADLWTVDLRFYDLWADGYANDMPLPAPSLALVLVGLLGALGVAMRLRRPA